MIEKDEEKRREGRAQGWGVGVAAAVFGVLMLANDLNEDDVLASAGVLAIAAVLGYYVYTVLKR